MEAKKYHAIEELPLVLTVDELMPVLNIGRNTAYNLVRSGQIQSLHIGHKIRIPRDAVVKFITDCAA